MCIIHVINISTVLTDSLTGDGQLSDSMEEEEEEEEVSYTDEDVFDESVKNSAFTPFNNRPYITSESRVHVTDCPYIHVPRNPFLKQVISITMLLNWRRLDKQWLER